jgi:hypothetical protein
VGAPVKVSDVELNDARAVKLVDWGWKGPRTTLQDPQPGIATQLGEGFTHKPIDVRCPSRYGALFVLSLERTGPGAGTERSFTIKYEGGSLVVRFGIALCPGKCTQEQLHAAGNE